MLKTTNPKRPASLDELLDGQLAARIGRLDLASRKIFFGKLQGERRSKKRGHSVEFADHRPYVAGDDLRHIDWNIYGRLDRLFMKLFLEEEDLSLHLVIDCSTSMDCGNPSKFFFAQQIAASLGYIGLVNLNRVACTAIGRRDETSVLGSIRDLRGRRRMPEFGQFLCGLRPEHSSDFRDACRRIALTRRGKGVMIVLSDFLLKEGYEDGLRLLVGRGYDVFAMQVLSPQEIEPDLTGDLRLRDVEDLDAADVTISAPLMKRYKATLAAYCDQLRLFCAAREITHLTVRTDTPMETLILEYLRRRGVVR